MTLLAPTIIRGPPSRARTVGHCAPHRQTSPRGRPHLAVGSRRHPDLRRRPGQRVATPGVLARNEAAVRHPLGRPITPGTLAPRFPAQCRQVWRPRQARGIDSSVSQTVRARRKWRVEPGRAGRAPCAVRRVRRPARTCLPPSACSATPTMFHVERERPSPTAPWSHSSTIAASRTAAPGQSCLAGIRDQKWQTTASCRRGPGWRAGRPQGTSASRGVALMTRQAQCRHRLRCQRGRNRSSFSPPLATRGSRVRCPSWLSCSVPGDEPARHTASTFVRCAQRDGQSPWFR
jgi:hypothetical protein